MGAVPGGGIDRYGLREIVSDAEAARRFLAYIDPAGLVIGGRVEPRWLPDGCSFSYVEGPPDAPVTVSVDGRTGEISRAPRLDPAASGEMPTGPGFNTAILHTYGISLDRYWPRPARRAKLFREYSIVRETPSPDRWWFASVRDGNIVLRSPLDDATVALTTDAAPRFGWDVEAPRSIWTAGLQLGERFLDPWSPDGLHLFAIKVDCRAVPDQPFIRYLKREEECAWAKIIRAGGPMDIAHPHVIDILSRRARPLDVGATEDRFFTLLGWLPDSRKVLFTRHSRDFKQVDVLAGDPLDGEVRTLFSESARTFVALQHDVMMGGDHHAAILSDSSGLVWRSSRDGWNHFYLYDLDGRLVRQLTRGDYAAMDIEAIDLEGGWLYFSAHHDPRRPYDRHLCRVALAGGDVQRLTDLDGENVASISPSKRTFTVVNSRPDRPFRTDFHASDGRRLATIQEADISRLERLGHVAPEEFRVTAADDATELWGVMYKPADFDPRKRYAIVDHIYGGPQVSRVVHHFGLGESTHDRLDRALAQLGYIVVCLDARGTPERSKAFQDVVYGNWGRHEIPDHAAALRQLAARHSYIDLGRAGIWGHSWGGYFTLRGMAQAPDLFRVGAAVAPGTDPYDAILHEPYLDLPTRAKAAYDYACLYPLAGQIKGKLLLVGGTADPMCYANTIEMTHYLIQAGIEHELVVLPEATHYFEGRNDEYFVRKLVTHFIRHLPPT